MAKIIGEYPPVERVVTNLWSLDKALSNQHQVGVPLTMYEVTGFGGVGKSTWVSSILGMIGAQHGKDLVYAPIEAIDRDLLKDVLDSVSFNGECHIITGQTDEEIVDSYCELLQEERIIGGVFDSLTAISPIAEMESSSADMNMGRRARLAGVLARKLVHLNRFRNTPVISFIISHISTPMSQTPTNTGSSTTGGETKKNLSKVRIKLRKLPEPSMMELENNAFVVEGVVEKFNYGKDKRRFYNVILGGKGVHVGLSAVYDCRVLKLASFGKSVTLDGKKYGNIRTLIQKAHQGEVEVFVPFQEALKNPEAISKAPPDNADEGAFMEELPE